MWGHIKLTVLFRLSKPSSFSKIDWILILPIDLFIALNKFCKDSDLEISDFLQTKGTLKGDLYEALKNFEEQIQWRSGPKVLLRRLRRIGSRKTFSVRETKLLRKLINAQKKQGYVDFDEILEEFPGKTVEILKEKYNEKYLYWVKKRTYRKRKVL